MSEDFLCFLLFWLSHLGPEMLVVPGRVKATGSPMVHGRGLTTKEYLVNMSVVPTLIDPDQEHLPNIPENFVKGLQNAHLQ